MPTNRQGYKSEYYHRRRAEIIKQLGGKCLMCETTLNLEIHHLLGYKGLQVNGRGQLIRLRDWRDNIDDLILLCYECHQWHHDLEVSTKL